MNTPGLPRRRLLTHGLTAAGALAAGGLGGAAIQRTLTEGAVPAAAPARTLLNDASQLNPTPVRGLLFAQPSATATGQALRPLLRAVNDGDQPGLAVSGTRHSMGGQSLLRDGWNLDTLPMNHLAVDVRQRTVRVGAGTTWKQLIPALNAHGLAPAVMQSNHDFSLGGSLSVNCHGWHTNSGPLASTVRRLLVLTADGQTVTCGPDHNPELFGLVLGGYGLFGTILEADLAVLPNVTYRPQFTEVGTEEYASAFTQQAYAQGTGVEMAYGRLSVDPGSFLTEAIIGTYRPVPGTRGRVLPLPSVPLGQAQRMIFRNSARGSAGKKLRWWLERETGPWIAGEVSRNSLLNEPAAVFANTTPGSTDILHEYFVPQPRLWDFVQAARRIIPNHQGNLLNVTVRDVRRDTHTALAYARQDVFGLVMLFVQEKSAAGENRMRQLTTALIDAALATGGTFYLPYRLHATAAQLRRGYPSWERVLAAKEHHDPHGVFRNALYERYR